MRRASGAFRIPKGFGLDRFSGIYLWLLFVIVFGIWAPSTFLTIDTVHSVGATQAVPAILAMALLIPLVAGQFDLSVGANANLSAIVAIELLNHDHSIPVSIAVAVGVGVAIGILNGFIVVKLKVMSLIATLGTGSILGAAMVIVSGNLLPPPPANLSWSKLTQSQIGGFQIVVLYMLFIAVVVWWFLEFTPIGRRLYAIGSNADSARLAGVRVERLSWMSMIISGGLAGLGGVLYASQAGPSLSFGASLLLPAFAAAFLGSTQLQPGRMNVWGTLLAIYVLATGVQGMQFVANQQWVEGMFNGVALILAVSLSVSRRRERVEAPADGDQDGVSERSANDAEMASDTAIGNGPIVSRE